MATNKEKTLEEKIEEFFTDPKHSSDANFMRGAVKKVIAEVRAEEEAKKKEENPEPVSFFDSFFGGK